MRAHAPRAVAGYQHGVVKGDGGHRYVPPASPETVARGLEAATCERCHTVLGSRFYVPRGNEYLGPVCGLCAEKLAGLRPAARRGRG